MPYVQMNENESFEGGMRRFKRQVERAGLLTEMRMRMGLRKTDYSSQAAQNRRDQTAPPQVTDAFFADP